MADVTINNDFNWETIVFKVEDQLFCVPRFGFVQSSEVFADMFLLPRSAVRNEGQDREHPIFLEGYKKDEFACLLKVMYPTAESLISGTKYELCLEKDEWVSVLKLSVIWNMKKIREYAIHKLSTEAALSPIEKILLARAHKVAAWLDEGVNSLISSDFKPTLNDFAQLGWETAARILWIRDDSRPFIVGATTLHFRRDTIKCSFCSSASSLINGTHSCNHCSRAMLADEELKHPGPSSVSGTADRLVSLRGIQSSTCGENPFGMANFPCNSCGRCVSYHHNVRITPKLSKEIVKEMFGEEIKDYEMAAA